MDLCLTEKEPSNVAAQVTNSNVSKAILETNDWSQLRKHCEAACAKKQKLPATCMCVFVPNSNRRTHKSM